MTDSTRRDPEQVKENRRGESAQGEPISARPDAAPPARPPRKERSASLWADAWRELYHNPIFVISGVVALLICSMAAFPRLWATGRPVGCDLGNARLPPSGEHIFGTTQFGCDMYSAVVWGARPSIVIAVVATIGVTVIGVFLGTLAGFYGGFLDTVISRFTDIVIGIPFILGALIVLSLLNNHAPLVIAGTIIVLAWVQMTRIMRGSVIAVKNQDFVTASRALGAGNGYIMVRHILPNAIAPGIVLAALYLGGFVSVEATLTFLGIGLQLPDVSWGILITNGQDWALTGQWWLLVFPCLFLVITVLTFTLVGDAVRDALDPKIR